MQYLLRKEELDALRPQEDVELRDKALEAAKNEILKQAGYVCIYKDEDEHAHYRVCDDCPCSSIGDGKEYKLFELICTDRKEYSQ